MHGTHYGSIIAKRLHVKGDEKGVEDDAVEHLQYVTPATKCKGKACPSGTSHTPYNSDSTLARRSGRAA